MKKIIAMFLIAAICLTALPCAVAAEKDDVVKYSVKVNSSIVGEKYITVIKPDDKILMDVDDICKLTNSTRVDDGDIIVIKRGSRNVNINTVNKQLIESHLEQPKPIVLEVVDGEVYLPAYSMLIYLGADCLLQDDAVQIRMPLFSFWDVNDFDMSKYALDLNQLWGKGLKWHMLNDMISELVFDIGCVDNVFYVSQLVAGYDKVIEDVMRDSLDINPLNYKSVKEEYKIYFDSDSALKRIRDSYNNNEDFEKIFSKTIEKAENFFEYMEESKIASMKKYRRIQMKERLLKKSEFYGFLKDLTKLADGVTFLYDVVNTYYINSNYAEDGIYAIGSFRDGIGKVDLKSPYYKTSNKIYNLLISNMNSIGGAILDEMIERLIDKCSEEMTKLLLSTTYAPIVDVIDLGISLYASCPGVSDEIERCSAELRAMYLVTLQSITCRLLTDKLQEIDNTMNEYNLAEYKQLLSFWARVSIAANEKLVECGLDVEAAKARNEELALILYKLNNCQVIGIYWQEVDPIFVNAELSEVGNFKWIIEPSIEADDIQPFRLDSPNREGMYAECVNYSKFNRIIRSGKSGGINYQGKITLPIEKNIGPCLEGFVSEDHETAYDENGIPTEPIGHGGYDIDFFFDVKNEKTIAYGMGNGGFSWSEWDVQGEHFYDNLFLEAVNPSNKADEYDKTGKYVYVSFKGELIRKTQFDDATELREEFAAVKKDKKWGYINTSGKTVIPFEYDYAYNFDDGIAAVCKNGKWGYIDKDNNVVIDFKFEATRPHYEGQAWVKQNGKWGVIEFANLLRPDLIDYSGKVIQPELKYQTLESNGVKLVGNLPVHLEFSAEYNATYKYYTVSTILDDQEYFPIDYSREYPKLYLPMPDETFNVVYFNARKANNDNVLLGTEDGYVVAEYWGSGSFRIEYDPEYTADTDF